MCICLFCPAAPVFSGGHAYGGAEYVLEIIGIVIADGSGNLRDGQGRIDQQILRLADTAEGYIFHG